MTLPARYGIAAGPYKLTQDSPPLILNLLNGGVNIAKAPTDLDEGESPNAVDVRLHDGGVSSDFAVTALGAVSGTGQGIIHLADFEKKVSTGTKLVRMRTTGWDRWDGASWVALNSTPAIVNLSTDRLYSVVMQDMLVVANRVNQLLAWDGVDADPIINLSADAPTAWFNAPLGRRMIAAKIKIGGSIDPYGVAWSTDGNIQDWTTSALGAGSTTLEPEIRLGPDFIMGLSGIETAINIYRQKSIVQGVRTGVGALPFRFTTRIYGLGTESPYSIQNVGHSIGDLFLGSDLNVYLWSGEGEPIPVSDPIRLFLKTQIQDPALCVGTIDRKNLEYWLLIKRAAALPDMAWILSIKDLIVNKRISWRRRDLPTTYGTASFAKTATQSNPVVNAVTDIVNTVNIRVNDYGLSIAPQRMVLGDGVGGVWYLDETKFLSTGTWESKMVGRSDRNSYVDRTWLMCQSSSGAVIELSLSMNGGVTWTLPKQLNVPSGNYTQAVATWFDQVMQNWQFRIRILSGQVTISQIKANVADRGPIAA